MSASIVYLVWNTKHYYKSIVQGTREEDIAAIA
jgi:hypothetical protein